MVTDVTLQKHDESNIHLPKTLLVCVTSSCVLDPTVQEALTKAASSSFLFRDALKDQGKIYLIFPLFPLFLHCQRLDMRPHSYNAGVLPLNSI